MKNSTNRHKCKYWRRNVEKVSWCVRVSVSVSLSTPPSVSSNATPLQSYRANTLAEAEHTLSLQTAGYFVCSPHRLRLADMCLLQPPLVRTRSCHPSWPSALMGRHASVAPCRADPQLRSVAHAPLPSMPHAGEQVNVRAPAGPLTSNMAPHGRVDACPHANARKTSLSLLWKASGGGTFCGILSQTDAPVNHFGRWRIAATCTNRWRRADKDVRAVRWHYRIKTMIKTSE